MWPFRKQPRLDSVLTQLNQVYAELAETKAAFETTQTVMKEAQSSVKELRLAVESALQAEFREWREFALKVEKPDYGFIGEVIRRAVGDSAQGLGDAIVERVQVVSPDKLFVSGPTSLFLDALRRLDKSEGNRTAHVARRLVLVEKAVAAFVVAAQKNIGPVPEIDRTIGDDEP